MSKWGKRISRGGLAASVGIGAYETYQGIDADGGRFGYNAQYAASSSIGGIGGATGGAAIGFSIGACFGGIGAIPGAAIGGFIGGMVGGYGGSALGGWAVDSYYGY